MEYGPGGAFGELALLHGEPRQATVRAAAPAPAAGCVCWALGRSAFRHIMAAAGQHRIDARVALLARAPLLAQTTPFERFQLAEVPPPP
jgi:cAMP-dependent protein kinase regulator